MKTRKVLLRVAAAMAIAGVLTTASAAAGTPPRWLVVGPNGSIHHESVENFVWATGRVWILKGSSGGAYVATSARVSNGRLGSWVTAKAPSTSGWVQTALLGQDLILRISSSLEPEDSLRAMRLLPNGKFGIPGEVGGAPPPPSSIGSQAIRLSDRAVQLVGIGKGGRLIADPGACCDLDGNPVDFASFVPLRSSTELGLDRRGRIWLAWTPPGKGRAGIVELDPATLRPRGKPSLIPGPFVSFGIARSLRALVCTDVCRLVVEAFARPTYGDFTWAPGERAATRLALPGTGFRAVEYAEDDKGHLVVAFGYTEGNAVRVGLARGDARGSQLRLVSSIDQPQALGSRNRPAILSTRTVVGAFGPSGFAAFAFYENGAVRMAILPLRS